jgi:hypothetical protein
MLILTWAVILVFAGRFFWKVLTVPVRKGAGDETASAAPPPEAPR